MPLAEIDLQKFLDDLGREVLLSLQPNEGCRPLIEFSLRFVVHLGTTASEAN